jgi:tetratricopeptide (TPR) repeat protein
LVFSHATAAVIDDFEISSTLSKEGVTPSMVSHALDSKLRDIQAVATTAMALKSLSVDKPPQFVIPGTGVSLNFLIEQIRRLLPTSQWRVGGAILTLKDQMQTVIRIEVSDEHRIYDNTYDKAAAAGCASNKFVAIDSDKNGWPELSAQLSCASEFILRHAQPYILAVYYKETGNIKAAKELLLSMLYHAPHTDDHWALDLLGSIASEEAQNTKDPQRRETLTREAENYFQKSDAAYEVLKKKRLMPPFVLTYVNRGILYASQKNYVQAEQNYQQAIREDPSYGIAYSNLAAMKARQAAAATDDTARSRLWNEAFENYQRGSERTPNQQQKAIVLTSWARSLLDAKKYSEARDKVDSAIAADSTYADAHFLKGEILEKADKENPQEILDAFAAAEKLKQWSEAYAIRYAKALRQNDKPEESIAEFEKILKQNPANASVTFEYAKTLAATVKDKPARYASSLGNFYKAYDWTARNNPRSGFLATIEDQVWKLVNLDLKVVSENPDAGADIAKRKQTVLLDAGDQFLRGGYVLANRFYAEAVRIAPKEKPAEDLIKRVIARLETAARNSTEARRASFIDLAWRYSPMSENLLIEKFMSLIANDDTDDARSFASLWCGGKRDFEATAQRQLGATWSCPD